MTGPELPSDRAPASACGGGLKLGKPVGGVFGPSCSAEWALKPPLDGVGIAAWVGLWLDG